MNSVAATSTPEIAVPLWQRALLVLCFMTLSGGLYGLFFGEDDYGRQLGEINILAQLIQLPVYLFAIFATLRQPWPQLRYFKTMPLLGLLTALAVASVLWSIDPMATLRRSILLVVCSLFGLGLATLYPRAVVLRCLAIAFIILAGISLAAAVVMPDVAIHHDQHYPALRGLFTHKNTCGVVMLIGVLAGLALVQGKTSRTLGFAAMAICSLVVVLSLSMTAILILVLLFILNLLLQIVAKAKMLGLILVGFAILVLGVLFATGILADLFAMVVGSLGRDTTLTGRDQIWFTLWNLLKHEAFWLGYGYDAFWTSERGAPSILWGMSGYVPPHAHNGFLQVWTSLGLAGVTLLVGLLLGYGVRALVLLQREGSGARIYMLFGLYYLLINISEQSFLTYSNIFWPLFLYFAASLQKRLKA